MAALGLLRCSRRQEMALLRKHSRLASTALLFAIFALLLSFLPGPNARAEQSGPALNISSIECTDEGAVVHFALARNVSTEAQIGAATLSFTYTMGDGPPQTATAIFDRIAGK